ncbi:MAG: Hsp20/alpha crystallin family protein [Desulfobacteraceae bacterium]|nr:Hsp20/alpha crystallin family protein [Desulfobacteraceae bacterium]
MSDTRNELQAKDKKEVSAAAEQTKPGPVFTPAVDIFETETALTILADLPGVTPEALDIDLHDDTLSIIGDIIPEKTDGENLLLKEYETGRYVRKFSLSEVINQNKIKAELADGVLRLDLPKVEKAQPRKIAVAAG